MYSHGLLSLSCTLHFGNSEHEVSRSAIRSVYIRDNAGLGKHRGSSRFCLAKIPGVNNEGRVCPWIFILASTPSFVPSLTLRTKTMQFGLEIK